MSSDKRYHLRIPTTLYEELGEVAEARGTNRLTLIKKFIKLGLLVIKLEDEESDSGLYFKRNGEIERLTIL